MSANNGQIIRFFCFHCYEPVSAGAASAGGRGRCPRCGQLMAIPRESTRAPSTSRTRKQLVIQPRPPGGDPNDRLAPPSLEDELADLMAGAEAPEGASTPEDSAPGPAGSPTTSDSPPVAVSAGPAVPANVPIANPSSRARGSGSSVRPPVTAATPPAPAKPATAPPPVAKVISTPHVAAPRELPLQAPPQLPPQSAAAPSGGASPPTARKMPLFPPHQVVAETCVAVPCPFCGSRNMILGSSRQNAMLRCGHCGEEFMNKHFDAMPDDEGDEATALPPRESSNGAPATAARPADGTPMDSRKVEAWKQVFRGKDPGPGE